MKIQLFLFFLLISSIGFCQKDSSLAIYQNYWSKMDNEFKDSETSPLASEKIKLFDSIPRYAFDESFLVMAKWIEIKNSKSLYFDTTGEIKQKYKPVAQVRFSIDNDTLELLVYKNIMLSKSKEYRDYLFIPFSDESNGLSTYGGGRYLSFHAQPKDSVLLDFNQAYNPYCAYNSKYSCPIPPRENSLPIAIKAGARYH